MEVTSPLVTRIYGLVAGTDGMLPEDPLRARRRTGGHRAVWALCMMPSAWDRLFNLDQTSFIWAPGGLAASTRLAVMYQAQRWAYSILGMLRDLLLDSCGSMHSHDEDLPAIQRLIQILISHRDIIACPFESYFSPAPSNPCLPLFMELEAAYYETRVSTPMAVTLDKIGCIVVALYEKHDWAYNCLVFMAIFIDRGLSRLLTDEADPSFEPLRTCYSILSKIESHPPQRLVTDESITFPPTIQDLEFSYFTPSLLDTLARIVFRMFPFFSSCDIQRYLRERRNAEAIQYVLTDCDFTKLPHALAPRWDPIYEAVHSNTLEITIVASCLDSDSVAIGFIDAVLAHESPVSFPNYPQIGAVQYLRRVKQVNEELFRLSLGSLPRAALFPRVQEICHQELFYDISPLFLPHDVDIATAVKFLRIHLLNKYILLLSNFFETPIADTATINLSAFNRFAVPGFFLWTFVDREIQERFFVALLVYNKAIAANNLRSDVTVIAKQLWGSDLFWIEFFWEGRKPRIEGIEPSSLQLLQESLELYDRVSKPFERDKISVDFRDLKRLLEAVQKQLSRAVGRDAGEDAVVANEAEGTAPKPMESDDKIVDDHGGISAENRIQTMRTE
ncbi:hypothetical protein MSAN_02056500 [Mycena sanguinolenta]|uniref:Uncharacterized protein n=1 Tax=Mycena sanguinolenta TaxID=230812 RepID=A0A8H6XJ34_9AGAR|nr:hypothetical protein MSAN_02056500 [Mycena sanguinolenta]